MNLRTDQITAFQATVLGYYDSRGRHELPWRLSNNSIFDPYQILVSELMLQQTQVSRVIPKYALFLNRFSNVTDLAATDLASVLQAWNGLGYNRRAKFLWQAAQMVVAEYNGIFPKTIAELVCLPGVGKNTAGAIAAYAFNQPVVFVETNIRTVFIHHFFANQSAVGDAAIIDLVQQTLPNDMPRIWYWALMDYGSHLKQTVGNKSQLSTSYAKQPAFLGSKRQIRGQVIKLLMVQPSSFELLDSEIGDEQLSVVLADLLSEQLIQTSNDTYHL